MRRRTVAVAVLMSAFVGSLIGIGAVEIWDSGGGNGGTVAAIPTRTASPSKESTQNASVATDCLSAADVYERVRPAVLEVASTLGSSGGFGPQAQGTGTGGIFDTDGHILTNHHVIDGASSIEVRFADGSTASAKEVGSDPANDLAVIEVNVS